MVAPREPPTCRPAELAAGDPIEGFSAISQEGLEKFSQRRTAKLLGENRSALWRYRWMAKLPEKLFTRLMRKPGNPASTKMLADISRAMAGKDTAEGEAARIAAACRA
jgi:hypothetical protein